MSDTIQKLPPLPAKEAVSEGCDIGPEVLAECMAKEGGVPNEMDSR